MSPSPEPVLTLEPLLDAVREGVEEAGWTLLGLQKTTSHEFEGRWAGDSTRSAYLFFHKPGGPPWASVDAFLDETSRGLTGNLALVVDARALGGLGDVPEALSALAGLRAQFVSSQSTGPITLRLHLPSATAPVDEAETEIRFKIRIPRTAMEAGAAGLTAMAADAVRRFEELMLADALRQFLDP